MNTIETHTNYCMQAMKSISSLMRNKKYKGVFITGTNTGVGKTFFSILLIRTLNQLEWQTVGIKPIASGCNKTPLGLRNNDALQLQQHSFLTFDYSQINPFAFEPPIAPHIAAAQCEESLTVNKLLSACQPVLQSQADIIVVEGIGGWQVPLNHHEMLADFAIALKFPIILVVCMTLGCLNHTILTVQSIQQSNLPFLGWIANCIDPNMIALQENIETLKKIIAEPCLATIPYMR